MSTLRNYSDDPAELSVETRGALRSVVAIADELGRDRWEKNTLPLDPCNAGPAERDAAIRCALLGSVNAIAGLGCLRSDHKVAPEVLALMVPFLRTVEMRATVLIESLEDDVGSDMTDGPGFGDVLELLVGLVHATQAAKALWGMG